MTTVSRLNPTERDVRETLVSFEVEDIDSYVPASWYHIAVDNDVAYWAALSYEGQQLTDRLASYSLSDPSAKLRVGRCTVSDPPGEMAMILKCDVDDGHAVIQPWIAGGGDSHLIFYDINTGSVELVDTGLDVFDVQIIHQGE